MGAASTSVCCVCPRLGLQSLQLDPSNIKTYNNRGYSFAKRGMYTDAIADYTQVPLGRHTALCVFMLCLVHAAMLPCCRGSWPAGDTILLLLASSSSCRISRAVAVFRPINRNAPSPCLVRVPQVIQMDPNNSHAYHNRGISYDKKGEFEKVRRTAAPRLTYSARTARGAAREPHAQHDVSNVSKT